MSSGQKKPHYGFNDMQIKDGWIVRINKNTQAVRKIEPYKPKTGVK
jgi:hypothetical protein